MSKATQKRNINWAWWFLLFVPILITLTLGAGDGLADVSEASGSSALPNSAASQSTHKVIAPPGVLDTSLEGVILWHDYGSFGLYRLSDDALSRLPKDVRDQIHLAEDMDQILIDGYQKDDQLSDVGKFTNLDAADAGGPALHLVQFVGPIKDEWLREIESAGAAPIQYIATNAYLLWADADSRSKLDQMVADYEILQFSAPYPPHLKIGPALAEKDDPDQIVPVVIQMYRHTDKTASESAIQNVEIAQLSEWTPILKFQNLITSVRVSDVPKLASLPDVFWIEERMARQRMDEVQGQIMAGNLNGSQTGPASTGYLTWLNSYSFSTDPNNYPIVDITDDGIGNGTVNSGDATLHKFGTLAETTRLAYVANCTSATDGSGLDGHGHINVSIAGGYDTRSGFPFQDPSGYQRGLGINPYGRFAGTRIFGPGFNLSKCGGDDTGLIRSIQDNGARISSNSWGCSGCAGSYDDSSQAFDAGTRDADLTEPGNQEMIFIFSAGNDGSSAGTIGTPGNGKNMITVGASENYRPSDEDGNWTDGCAIGPAGANNAMDVIDFSSRGPAPGGRVKPELIAPGTHIHGTASTHASYDGSSVCDQYRPSGQTTFAASSGTSHSTPAVAGAASLAYWWLENTYSLTPSPAMMKAYLIAHPTYLTGKSANDTLPSNSQGYGMPNMTAMFDDADKSLLDQSFVFDDTGETWTWNGSVADPTKPVRIVLTYTDAPGAIGTSPQVNDLNLAAEVDSSTYLGNVFTGQWSTTGGALDAANNYEAIFLPTGTTGAVEITITAFNIAGDGIPNSGDGTDQDFAVVCYNCTQTPDFTLNTTPDILEVCTPGEAVFNVEVGQLNGFTDLVSLSASGYPAGTTANFSTNPVAPPGSSSLTIGNTGASAAGSYSLNITGTSTTDPFSTPVTLNLYDAAPAASTPLTPTNSATGVPFQPTLTWTTVPQAASYLLEIAADIGFTSTVYSTTETSDSHTLSTALNPLTPYYWRVSAQNACGAEPSSTFSFTTDFPSLACNRPTVTFETGIPDDWSIADNTGGAGIVWTTTADPDCGIANLTNGSGEAACADSDAAGFGSPAYDTELVSNSIDLTAYYYTATLETKAYYRDISTGFIDRFELDVWDGSSWTNELSWDEDHQPDDINLDLSAYTGLSDVRVRFRYSGNGWDWYAQVDDISLTCAAPIIGVEPTDLSGSQSPGDQSTQPITITNRGDLMLNWSIEENTSGCDAATDISWLSVTPTSGATDPISSTIVDVVVDSTGQVPGDYTANLCVISNDPATPLVVVPVDLTVEKPDITISETSNPTSILEPGDKVEFSIEVTNNVSRKQRIISLVDSDFDLAADCPGAIDTVLSPEESYICTFSGFVAGNAGEEYQNSVTVTARDEMSNVVTMTDTALVTLLNVNPVISVTEVAKLSLVQPGDTVAFTITVTNNSVDTDPVTVDSITGDVYGDVTQVDGDIIATDCLTGITSQPGGAYSCSYTVRIQAIPGSGLTNTITVSAIDDEGNQALASDETTVIFDYFSYHFPLIFR